MQFNCYSVTKKSVVIVVTQIKIIIPLSKKIKKIIWIDRLVKNNDNNDNCSNFKFKWSIFRPNTWWNFMTSDKLM